MVLEGFEVEVRKVAKGAYRCYLKFPTLLYEQGLSPFQAEKILIQVDTTRPRLCSINQKYPD